GLALGQLKRPAEAANAFRNATVISPGLILPYRLLARSLRQIGRKEEAQTTLQRAKDLRYVYDFQKTTRQAAIRDAADARSRERRAARQKRREEQARQKADADAVPPLDLVLVTGLPRSGTSMMMQML